MDFPVDAHTRLVALLGDPVEHSLSPIIHNAAFRAQGINFLYVALRVSPDDVEEGVRGLLALRFAGANVTAPHKQAVIPALDELSPQARAVGAVNTIICRHDSGRSTLLGDNTDVAGFLAPLSNVAAGLKGAPMVILGSGGAARAVAYALLTAFQPARLTLAARSLTHARALARDLAAYDTGNSLAVSPLRESGEVIRKSILIVNATTLGTHPHVDNTPWHQPGDFSPEHIVYDLVYNPEETRLLREASARGAATIGGLEMLIAQAAASYAEWTGREMPTDAVRNALRDRAGME